jgi:4-amino-4-deoxy-L-arabinose transferase-like glycosyltransferase
LGNKEHPITRKPPHPSESHRVLWKHALIILLVALVFRGAYLIEVGRRPDFSLFYMDEEYHLEWARSLVSGVWNPPYDQLKEAPYFRAPLYPFFLAGLLTVLEGSTLAVRVFQTMLGSISCVLLYVLGTKVFGRRTGLVAGLICSCYWVLAYFDTQLLLPVLLVFLLLAGMLCAYMAADRRSLPMAGFAGLVFGLFAITRPNILTFFPFLAWWAVSLRRSQSERVKRWFALLLIAGMVLPPIGVTLRNRIVGKDWVPIASQGGVNFYIGNNARSNGMQAVVPGTRQTWWGGYEDTRAIAEKAAGHALKASEVSDYWFRQAFSFIRSSPAAWLRLTLRKAAAFIGDVELPNNEPYEAYRRESVTLRSIPLGFGIVFGLFLVSLPFQLRERKRLQAPGRWGDGIRAGFITLILVLLAIYSLSVIAFFVTGRYRVPLVPFFAMGAGFTVVAVYDLFRRRALAKAMITLGVAVLVIGILRTDYLGVRRATGGFVELSTAQDRLDTGDVDGAIAALERIRREGSVNAPEVYISLARAYIERGSPSDLDAAFRLSEEGLRRYPGTAELLWYSAAGYASQRNWPMVLRRVEEFTAVEPGNMRALYLGFTAAIESGDAKTARTYLDKAAALDPAHPLVAEMRSRLDTRIFP